MTRNPEGSNNPDVVVVGGGLAGLAAAATVAAQGRSVQVLEKRNAVGGQARSVVSDGFTFNQGPHALYRSGAAERVLTNLGVAMVGAAPPVKGKIVFDSKPEIGPADAITLMRTKALSMKQKLSVGLLLGKLPRLKSSNFGSVSTNDWIAQAVPDERSAQMVRSLVRLATYVNQPEQLSADVAISQLQTALGAGVLYLDNGWQTMVDQLRSTAGVSFVESQSVSELPDAPAVIVAVGGPAATSSLIGKSFDLGPEAAVSSIDFGLSKRPTSDVVIGGDEPFFFSNHSSVARLAPEGQYHAAVVQYLRDGDQPDPEALEAFPSFAGVQARDVVTKRKLHRMTTVTAIPTASRGGLAGRPLVTETGHDGVFMAGDWVGPEGHLADASLASGEAAALSALAHLGSVRR